GRAGRAPAGRRGRLAGAAPLANGPRVLRARPARRPAAQEDRPGRHRPLPGAGDVGHAEAGDRLAREPRAGQSAQLGLVRRPRGGGGRRQPRRRWGVLRGETAARPGQTSCRDFAASLPATRGLIAAPWASASLFSVAGGAGGRCCVVTGDLPAAGSQASMRSAARYSPGWVRQARRGPRGSTSRPTAGLRLHPGVRPGAIRRRRWEWGQPPTLSWRAAWAADAEWMSGKSRARLAPVLTKASSGMSDRRAYGSPRFGAGRSRHET